MGGTLMLLKQAGFDIHYMNVANGSCGSTTMDANETRIVRAREGQAAAQILGATFHPSLCNDLEVVYSVELLRKLAAVIREVQPENRTDSLARRLHGRPHERLPPSRDRRFLSWHV